MWNITPDVVELAKEELRGRRAAIEARYADEIQKLTAEIGDIEAFERVATAFALKHNREGSSTVSEPDPTESLEAPPTDAGVGVAGNEIEHPEGPLADNPREMEISPGAETLPMTVDADVQQSASSRWRIRV